MAGALPSTPSQPPAPQLLLLALPRIVPVLLRQEAALLSPGAKGTGLRRGPLAIIGGRPGSAGLDTAVHATARLTQVLQVIVFQLTRLLRGAGPPARAGGWGCSEPWGARGWGWGLGAPQALLSQEEGQARRRGGPGYRHHRRGVNAWASRACGGKAHERNHRDRGAGGDLRLHGNRAKATRPQGPGTYPDRGLATPRRTPSRIRRPLPPPTPEKRQKEQSTGDQGGRKATAWLGSQTPLLAVRSRPASPQQPPRGRRPLAAPSPLPASARPLARFPQNPGHTRRVLPSPCLSARPTSCPRGMLRPGRAGGTVPTAARDEGEELVCCPAIQVHVAHGWLLAQHHVVTRDKIPGRDRRKGGQDGSGRKDRAWENTRGTTRLSRASRGHAQASPARPTARPQHCPSRAPGPRAPRGRARHPSAQPRVPENQLQQDILTAEVQQGPEEAQGDHAELGGGQGVTRAPRPPRRCRSQSGSPNPGPN